MSAIAATSSAGITPPVGFCGEFRISSLVRSARAVPKQVQVEGKAALFHQRHRHGRRAHESDHRFVDREAGVRVDDLVAGLEQRQHGEEDDRLAAGHDARRARGPTVDAARARDVGRDGVAQLGLGPRWGRSASSPRRAPAWRLRRCGAEWGNPARRFPGGRCCVPCASRRAGPHQHIEGGFRPRSGSCVPRVSSTRTSLDASWFLEVRHSVARLRSGPRGPRWKRARPGYGRSPGRPSSSVDDGGLVRRLVGERFGRGVDNGLRVDSTDAGFIELSFAPRMVTTQVAPEPPRFWARPRRAARTCRSPASQRICMHDVADLRDACGAHRVSLRL